MLYSPGDLFDKCSILEIKKDKGLDSVLHEYKAVKEEVEHYIKLEPDTYNLYAEILESNRKQFDLEDLVRVEKSLEKVGKIALEIREFNDNRVRIKNEINKLCGYQYLEAKRYKRG